MGNGESSGQINHDQYAYRIITVFPGSPAEYGEIESQIDFIKYNPIANGNKLFSEFLTEHEGKEVALIVYNII